MMTAAVIPGEQEKSPLVTVLEGRVRKLEQELESKEKEEDKMLRAVEQKYNNIKVTCVSIPQKGCNIGDQ